MEVCSGGPPLALVGTGRFARNKHVTFIRKMKPLADPATVLRIHAIVNRAVHVASVWNSRCTETLKHRSAGFLISVRKGAA